MIFMLYSSCPEQFPCILELVRRFLAYTYVYCMYTTLSLIQMIFMLYSSCPEQFPCILELVRRFRAYTYVYCMYTTLSLIQDACCL